MPSLKHENNGLCLKCDEIFNAFPNFHYDLREFFYSLQRKDPEIHISKAGRGAIEQRECLMRKASKADWLQSAHNFNCAFDTFFLINNRAEWPKNRYDVLCGKNGELLPPFVEWYGKPKSSFFELPHFELKGWKNLVKMGEIKPVEDV